MFGEAAEQTNLILVLPAAAAERSRARGEPLEALAERVLVSASEQVGGASLLTDSQRAELMARIAGGVEIADEAEVEAVFAVFDRD